MKAALAVVVIVVTVVVAVHYRNKQIREKADTVAAQAEATMSNFQDDQKDQILRALAALRSAKISGDISRLKSASDELERLMAQTFLVYNKPLFLLHIRAVATPKADGSGDEWVDNMYFAGNWVATPLEPNVEGVVKLSWGNVLPVWCLTDQRYGPYPNSAGLCSKAREISAKLPNELGCNY